MEQCLNAIWYGKSRPLRWVLYPLSLVFWLISQVRRFYMVKWRQKNFSVPVIVVGNISSGGVGKTPLVIAIVRKFMSEGIRVGIVSRGYKAESSYYPRLVKADDSAREVGDEPLLIVQKTGCPLVIDPNRTAAVEFLLRECSVQIILSDDGLQHYRMGRQFEIAVIDGHRGIGNGLCLPAGPLRESARRLREVDMIVATQGEWPGAESVALEIEGFYHLATGKAVNPQSIPQPILAVAGIGNPERFYTTLHSTGLEFTTKTYPDHYHFSALDFTKLKQASIVMTEKDAMKCRAFAPENSYYLSIRMSVSEVLWQRFKDKLQEKIKNEIKFS